MNPLLSIIIPLYNKQNCILESLHSVLNQRFEEYEIVIVDDGSTDNSIFVVKTVSDDRVRLFCKQNGGPSSARNYGIKQAKGEWILFLDADDTLEEKSLEIIIENIKCNPSVEVFTYNLYIKLLDGKHIFLDDSCNAFLSFPFLQWYLGRIYPRTGTMVVRRNVMLLEPFREDLRRWEDGECVFRLMRRYKFYASPIPIFTYNQDSLAASKPRSNYREDFVCQMEPKGKSFFEQMCMLKLYWEACSLYPEYVESIYGKTFRSLKYRIGVQMDYWYNKYLKRRS